MARPADPAYASLKVKPLLKKENWSYKTILLLFFLILALVSLVVCATTPGMIFFKYMNRRTFYGIWYLLVCDEYVSQWTWEHWWEYTTTMAYAECKYRFFPELGIRESYMLISDSIQTDQFSYLNSNAWLIASEALTTVAALLYIIAFIFVVMGIAKRSFSPVIIDGVVYLSIGLAAAMAATTGGLYMYKMFERCAFSTGSNCWIGYSFGFLCASVGFAIIAIFIRLCERRGLCCNGDNDTSYFAHIQAAQMGGGEAGGSSGGTGGRAFPGSSKLSGGTPPPGYPMSTMASTQKTVCTQL